MQCDYNSFIQIINFHGLFHNAPRCRKTGAAEYWCPYGTVVNPTDSKFWPDIRCFKNISFEILSMKMWERERERENTAPKIVIYHIQLKSQSLQKLNPSFCNFSWLSECEQLTFFVQKVDKKSTSWPSFSMACYANTILGGPYGLILID